MKKPLISLVPALLFLVNVLPAQDSFPDDPVKNAAARTLQDIYRNLDDGTIERLPIGVFDSGTGGLTVLEKILTIDAFDNESHGLSPKGDGKADFGNESFIFLADQANMPYGNYPVIGGEKLLDDLIVKDAWFLMSGGRLGITEPRGQGVEKSDLPVKAVVIACNTATAYGQIDIEQVIKDAGLDIKVVGVIDAGAKAAVEVLGGGQTATIGVVPTKGTVLSGAYPAAIRKHAKNAGLAQRIDIVQQGAVGLAGSIDGAGEFILLNARSSATRTDYRGPSLTNTEAMIDRNILVRYDFDFSENRMLYSGPLNAPTELQLNSVDNYIAYHLVTLMEQIRAVDDAPPLRAIILGCTHFPFYAATFRNELDRLRNYQEDGQYIYRKFMAERIELIDPAYFTARELYLSLTTDKRVRGRADTAGRPRGKFYITIPCRENPQVQLDGNGWFTYNYKYGRKAGQVASNFRAVELSEKIVDRNILDRLQKQVPAVWNLMAESHRTTEGSAAEQKINRIEECIGEDIGNRRGIAPLVKFSAGGLYGAARSIIDHPQPNVAIITGFYTPYAVPPSCETDGPPGTAHIALALYNAGIPCRVATDIINEPVVLASLWGAGLPGDFPVDTVSMDSHGKDGGRPLKEVVKSWREAKPPITHVIALERGGPAADGKPHNFSGDDITQWNAPLHRLFAAGDWTTIGIGDGGNEIGMGNIPPEMVAAHVKNGDKVGCAVKCDHLIVCGTSNWGGWALPMAMALLKPELREPLTANLNREVDYRILKVAVDKGRAAALESFAAKRAYPQMYVDALPWSVHGDKLDQLLDVLNHGP